MTSPADASGMQDRPRNGGAAAAGMSVAEERAPYRIRSEENQGSIDHRAVTGTQTGRANPAPGDWKGCKEFIKQQDPALCAKLESGKCLCCEEGRLRIGFDKGYLFFDDLVKRQAELAELCCRFFGRDTILEIEALAPEASGSPSARNGNGNGRAARNQRIQEIRREALSHPLVRKILDTFPGAEVRDVRVIETAAPAVPVDHEPVPQPEEMDLSSPPQEN